MAGATSSTRTRSEPRRGAHALFPTHGLTDYGFNLQVGYFIVPRDRNRGALVVDSRRAGDHQRQRPTLHPSLCRASPAPWTVWTAPSAIPRSQRVCHRLQLLLERQLLKWQTDSASRRRQPGGRRRCPGRVPRRLRRLDDPHADQMGVLEDAPLEFLLPGGAGSPGLAPFFFQGH